MNLLKRLLRPKQLLVVLEQAAALAGDNVRLAVADHEKVLACIPSDGPETDRETLMSMPGAVMADLKLEETVLGTLILSPESAETTSDQGRRKLVDFLGLTLSEMISREKARRSVAAETLDKYREIELLHAASLDLNNSLRLRDVCRALIEECTKAVPVAEMGMVLIRDSDCGRHVPFYSFGPAGAARLERLKDGRLFKEITAKTRGEIVNDLASDSRWENEVPGIRSLLAVPLVSPNLRVGALVLASSEAGPFDAAHLKRISTIASVAGISMGNAHHFEGMQLLMDALLQALAAAIDARDPMTSGHSQRVANLSVALARVLNADRIHFDDMRFSDLEIHELWYAGLLHDVGKIGIREQVLTKNTRLPVAHLEIIALRMALYSKMEGDAWQEDFERLTRINTTSSLDRDDLCFLKRLNATTFGIDGIKAPLVTDDELYSLTIPKGNLTPQEREEIERHPEESFRILKHIPFTDEFSRLLTIIHQHHERLDGSGYPEGLSGDEIMLQSRILAITDIYDAITQQRHYKPALSREQALSVLSREAERGRVDRRLVELFSRHIERIENEASLMEQSDERPERIRFRNSEKREEENDKRPRSTYMH